MKCKKAGCKKRAAKGQAYCSKACAPFYGRYGSKENHTKSEKTEKYSTVALGDQSPLLSEKESETLKLEERDTAKTPLSAVISLLKKQDITRGIEKEIRQSEKKIEKICPNISESKSLITAEGAGKMTQRETQSKEHGIEKITPPALKQSSLPSINGAQNERSIAPLLNLEEEKLASTSLVDECLGRLHLQMKRLTLREDSAALDPIGSSHNERQRVSLAIKTASEISKMVKLKLEAVKVFKELSGRKK